MLAALAAFLSLHLKSNFYVGKPLGIDFATQICVLQLLNATDTILTSFEGCIHARHIGLCSRLWETLGAYPRLARPSLAIVQLDFNRP